MTKEQIEEVAFCDYLGARDAALQGAAGYFTVSNVPSALLRVIIETTTDKTIQLAARTVLHQRGEDWR